VVQRFFFIFLRSGRRLLAPLRFHLHCYRSALRCGQ
jgi:hypothetical protein